MRRGFIMDIPSNVLIPLAQELVNDQNGRFKSRISLRITMNLLLMKLGSNT